MINLGFCVLNICIGLVFTSLGWNGILQFCLAGFFAVLAIIELQS